MKIQSAKIIITGAGSGFGKAMALDFSQKGAKIFAVDINIDSLKVLREDNSDIEIFKCDVSNNEEVNKIVQEIFNKESGINVLINNAGIMKSSPLINLFNSNDRKHSFVLFDKVIKTNLYSVFLMTSSVVDNMIRNRNKGVIINMSSIASKGNIGQTAYSASKASVNAMSKVWSKELGSYGIRSISISPGFIDTAGTHSAIDEKALKNWINKTPIKRTGQISEVVNSVLFSIENDFFNGETLKINGGLKI